MNYFRSFPLVEYKGHQVRDITRRAKLLDSITSNRFAYYVYELEDGERADQTAHRNYADSYYDWIVYLTNHVVDPYHDWALASNDLDAYIMDKYGSLERAMRLILFYKNAWEGSEQITVFAYEAKPENEWKYWEPVYGAGRSLVGYKRKQDDWILNTNHVVRYDTVQDASDFQINEPVSVIINASNTAAVGNAQVVSCNSSTVTVQHCEGLLHPNPAANAPLSSASITGLYSNASCVISSSEVVSTNFPDDGNNTVLFANSEPVYWRPITAYDAEVSFNNDKKNLRLLKQQPANVARESLRRVLSASI